MSDKSFRMSSSEQKSEEEEQEQEETSQATSSQVSIVLPLVLFSEQVIDHRFSPDRQVCLF